MGSSSLASITLSPCYLFNPCMAVIPIAEPPSRERLKPAFSFVIAFLAFPRNSCYSTNMRVMVLKALSWVAHYSAWGRFNALDPILAAAKNVRESSKDFPWVGQPLNSARPNVWCNKPCII
ncbi:hypothetical protein BDV12DRAFT_33292 [Aspergillus spectabilis]